MSDHHVLVGSTMLRLTPEGTGEVETELLHGESLTVTGQAGNWLSASVMFGQWRYTGYVETKDVGTIAFNPTHRVAVQRTPVLAAPALKAVAIDHLSRGSLVQVVEAGRFHVKTFPSGWIFTEHLVPIATKEADYVATIETLVGVPFVWGGRSTFGMDCSGMLEFGLRLAEISCARRMIHLSTSLGEALPENEKPERGDFLFYSEHCGMFISENEVINCNGKVGCVQIERFDELHHRMTRERNFIFQCIRRLPRRRPVLEPV